jgi:hypothetical protein
MLISLPVKSKFQFIHLSDLIHESVPKDLYVFFVGGVTFEEAAYVAQLNSSNPNSRIILGGNCILNSQMFLEEISPDLMKPKRKQESEDFVVLDMDHKERF